MDEILLAAQPLADHLMLRAGDTLYDGALLVQAVALGLLVGAGVPSDQAVRAVEELVARGLVQPTPANPMYHGLPWMVPGPASGAPYYSH